MYSKYKKYINKLSCTYHPASIIINILGSKFLLTLQNYISLGNPEIQILYKFKMFGG